MYIQLILPTILMKKVILISPQTFPFPKREGKIIFTCTFLSPQNAIYQHFVVKSISAAVLHLLTQLLIINVFAYHLYAKNDRILTAAVAFFRFLLIINARWRLNFLKYCSLIIFPFQKTTFWPSKHNLLVVKRPPFGPQNMTFWTSFDHLLKMIYA